MLCQVGQMIPIAESIVSYWVRVNTAICSRPNIICHIWYGNKEALAFSCSLYTNPLENQTFRRSRPRKKNCTHIHNIFCVAFPFHFVDKVHVVTAFSSDYRLVPLCLHISSTHTHTYTSPLHNITRILFTTR